MSALIEENDVTAVNFSLELERAVIAHKMDKEGEIYVTEENWFPFWIKIRKEPGYILLTTYTLFRKSADCLKRLELCNDLNGRSYVLTHPNV